MWAQAAIGALAAVGPCEPVRVDIAVSRSELSAGLADWREQSVALSRRYAAGWAGAVRVEHVGRFGADDVYGEIRADRVRGPAAFYGALGGAPDATFRPRLALKAGADLALGDDPALPRVLADIDVSQFRTGKVGAFKLGLGRYDTDDPFSYAAQAVAVAEAGGDASYGYALRGRSRLTPVLSLQASYADAPETSEGAVVRVQAASAGLSLHLSENVAVRLDATQEDRGGYGRTEIASALTLRF